MNEIEHKLASQPITMLGFQLNKHLKINFRHITNTNLIRYLSKYCLDIYPNSKIKEDVNMQPNLIKLDIYLYIHIQILQNV